MQQTGVSSTIRLMKTESAELGLFKRCGPIGSLVILTYRFGNRTTYGSYPSPIKFVRTAIYKICDVLLVRGLASAGIPARVQIGKGLRLLHDGNGVIIHPKVKIGDNVIIHQQVTIGEKSGDLGFPVVGDNVMIGAGAKILGGVRIGEGAKIGANAVVTKDVPPFSTAVGIPARILEK